MPRVRTFQADESGRWEIYVAAVPTFTLKRQISSGGGLQPQWRADGRELFYLTPDGSHERGTGFTFLLNWLNARSADGSTPVQ